MMCCLALGVTAQREVQQLADSIVKYQMKSGGWPKNQNWLQGVDPKEAKVWRKGIGSTIDNGATTTELATLAKAVDQILTMLAEASPWMDTDMLKTRHKNYVAAFKRGVEFLLQMQYDSGGFPQFYPAKPKEDYSVQITFNDNAMVNVLKVLRDVAGDSIQYRNMGLEKGMRKKCQVAYEKGLRCIVNCQIHVDENGRVVPFDSPSWRGSKATVWCQQHDRMTFVPVQARAYELPSYTAHGETCGLLNLLMDVRNPSSEMIEAVKSGVAWLEAHAMHDVVLEHFTNDEGKPDVRLAEKAGAPALWARYYDLERAEPMYCDRDGVPRKQLSEVGYERRNGYSWVGTDPQRVIARYRQWSAQHLVH